MVEAVAGTDNPTASQHGEHLRSRNSHESLAAGAPDEANAEFHKTSSLTKAANDSVFSKIENGRAE